MPTFIIKPHLSILMKAALPVVLLLATATACRATAPTDRNTLPNNRPVTEATMPETEEPSRKAGLELPAPLPPVKYPATRKVDHVDANPKIGLRQFLT